MTGRDVELPTGYEPFLRSLASRVQDAQLRAQRRRADGGEPGPEIVGEFEEFRQPGLGTASPCLGALRVVDVWAGSVLAERGLPLHDRGDQSPA